MLVDGVFGDLAAVAALGGKLLQRAHGEVGVDVFGIECRSTVPSSLAGSFVVDILLSIIAQREQSLQAKPHQRPERSEQQKKFAAGD